MLKSEIKTLSFESEERFFQKVHKTNSCWLWTGSKDTGGYGMIMLQGKGRKAHRVSWFIHQGYNAPEMVLHKCDIRNCVNPNHLFLGNQTDNMRDMSMKGRAVSPGRKGIAHHMAKLNELKIVEMRQKYNQGGISFSKIAKKYNITTMTAYRAITGKAWSHIK